MAVARFKDLCIDATDPERLGRFWSAVLDRRWKPEKSVIVGETRRHTVWINQVPEAKSVKHRVHLDIYAERLEDLEDLGATVVEPQHGKRTWTVMADPEGGEFCAFLRAPGGLPAERLHGLVVDCADHAAQAEWWGRVYGADVVHQPEGYSTVEHVEGMPILTMDFVPVPEAKAVKNRVHWDVSVTAEGLDALVASGATVLRPRDDEIVWHVLADPEGNEFCAFVD
ncbi:MAG: hypothetical protein J2P57_22450 [Acidimicrobiaceae bacterium]|nr:hypothetical protein [Acidimicrobiaceae bacterium]